MTTSKDFSFHQTGTNCFRFTNRTRLGFLGFEETEEVLKAARKLLKKKNERYGAPYVVFVDSEWVDCGNARSLRRVLSECYVDKDRFVVFRNLNGTATIHFDHAQKLSGEL